MSFMNTMGNHILHVCGGHHPGVFASLCNNKTHCITMLKCWCIFKIQKYENYF